MDGDRSATDDPLVRRLEQQLSVFAADIDEDHIEVALQAVELPPRIRGSSPIWADWDHSEMVPHMAALIAGLLDEPLAARPSAATLTAPGHTLDATALVHEAYLRLVGPVGERSFSNRGHFFAAAAEAMRRILVEYARKRARLKRGGDRQRLELGAVDPAVPEAPDELLALEEALTEFARKHPDKAALVQLRYFAGLTVEEAARSLGISTSTADRHWTFARAWLYRRIAGDAGL